MDQRESLLLADRHTAIESGLIVDAAFEDGGAFGSDQRRLLWVGATRDTHDGAYRQERAACATAKP